MPLVDLGNQRQVITGKKLPVIKLTYFLIN